MRKNNHNLNQVKSYSITLFVIASLLLFFHKPFEIFVDNYIVDTLFKYPRSWWVNDLVFLAFHLFGIFWIVQKIRIGYAASIKYLLISLFATTTYLVYREFHQIWTLAPLSSITSIKYLDFLISISIGQIVLMFTKRKPEENNNALFHDQPIGFDDEDILGYSKYAELVSDKILNSSFNNAFAIGINGKWGIGKTSFIDLIKRNTRLDKNVIEVNFNAWNSQDSNAIVTDFFNLMVEEITPYHDSLPQTFSKYSSQLLELNSGSNSSIGIILNLFKKDSSLVNLQNEIDSSLKEIGKKIIAFIDDVDRLNKKEIQEVVKLIRNTANFRNTFFVVAYDRNYVLNALNDLNNFNINSYLEKIFQLEVNLPSFENYKLRHELVKKLCDHFPSDIHDEIKRTILTSPSTGEATYLQEWLTTPRDVTRLANALTLNMYKLLGEVHFPDFLRIEILRLKYPFVYELLHSRRNKFMESSQNKIRHYHPYVLKKNNSKKNKPYSIKVQDEETSLNTVLATYLQKNKKSLFLKTEDIEKIEGFLKGIFVERFYVGESSHLSIRNPKRFRLYFSYGLLDGALSEVDFLNAIKSDKENLEEQIQLWIENGLYLEVRDRYEKFDNYENKAEFEKVIKSIFFLANQKMKDTPEWPFRTVDFDKGKLLEKIDNYDNRIVKKYYNYKGGEEDFIDFIKVVFDEAEPPFEFEAEIIREYNGRNNSNDEYFPLSDYWNYKVLFYFQSYLNTADRVDMFVWKLYHCCKRTKWKKTGRNSYITAGEELVSEEVNKIFKKFASKHIDSFIFSLIGIEPRKKNSYSLSDFVVKLFNSWQEVIELIDKKLEIEKDEILEEYKNFISTYSKAGDQYIEFDFQFVDIESKFK
ncbi:MAG: P-loop NTPase fold protein [Vicingaceae bacterium]